MSVEQRDDLLGLDVSPARRAALARKYPDLDDAQRQDVADVVAETGDDGAAVVAALDSDDLDDLLGVCGVSIQSAGGGGCPKKEWIIDVVEDRGYTGHDLDDLLDDLGDEGLIGASRHVENGITPSRLDELARRVEILNGRHSGDGYLRQYLRPKERFTLDDIGFSRSAANGDEVYLIDTNKWSPDLDPKDFDQGIHDFRHIVVRHVEKGADGEWPTTKGAAIDSNANTFPTDMKPSEVKDVIATTVKHADGNDIADKGSKYAIEYSGSKLPDNIDSMVVVWDKKSGKIISARPGTLQN